MSQRKEIFKFLWIFIYDIKRGIIEDNKEKMFSILREFKEKGIRIVILGCTELPLLFQRSYNDEKVKSLGQKYIDTTELLAKAIIKEAKK
ncbi:aspartate/glutamate racemase family protein [Alkaliphilus serpentinus]|uniref:aspartate/glutamate racemase family protein n=1 Tax=Alkaliphilus serpentinus TaxID=1482731 RepID=UPI001865718D|nr:aspartate/glutamate racemase family protein [Alkaliphilus serpentinus]